MSLKFIGNFEIHVRHCFTKQISKPMLLI